MTFMLKIANIGLYCLQRHSYCTNTPFLCRLRSIAAHRDHFGWHLSICPSISLCVCLSDSHTFLVVTHSYVSQATIFLICFFFQSSKLSFDASERFPQVTPVSDISYLVHPCENCEGVVYTAAMALLKFRGPGLLKENYVYKP